MSVEWEVFYTPHTDDETIGMAGAIVNARELGRKVMVVLVTDNLPSARGVRLFPDCDTAEERRIEWADALRELHVNDVRTWELREADMLTDPTAVQKEIERRILWLNHDRCVLHHHTVWGSDDVHTDAVGPTLAHTLCADALHMVAPMMTDVKMSLHGVYIYSRNVPERTAPIVRRLSLREHQRKVAALNCFKVHDDCIGYGYASVPELIDAAIADPREFTQEIPCG